MRRAARTDSTHAEVVAAFRALGCAVWQCHTAGNGAPDLVVAMGNGAVWFVEVKDAKGQRRPSQIEWAARWPLPVHVVRSVDEVIALVLPLDT